MYTGWINEASATETNNPVGFRDSEQCRAVMLIADRLNMAQLRYSCVEFMSNHLGV